MTRIIGISGRKQSGKNTSANFLHGLVLKANGLTSEFNIDSSGDLALQSTDITRKDDEFINYAETNMWPYVKLYSFADTLKAMCIDLFGLRPEQVYGTDEQKNTPTDLYVKNNTGNTRRSTATAREFMQYFGTNVCRSIKPNVWVDHLMKTIGREKTNLAIIADIRFPNEVDAVLDAGGEVIRLNRKPLTDSHASETSLDEGIFDQSKFSYIIPSGSIEDLCKSLESIFLKGSIC